MNLYGFVGNDAVNGWDYLGLTPDINVTLTRDSTGYFNTYGSIKVTINNQGVTVCCAPKKTEWKTLELPVGNYALQIGESEDNRRSAEDRPFRSLGPHTNSSLQNAVKTSPRALAMIYGAMVPEMKPEMNPDDYNNAISKAFNVFANINVHAGPGSWDSLFCPIIGNVYVPVPLRQMSEKRHHYPNVPDEPDGHRYIVHGFEINDSLRAQMEFNMIFACAERSLGRKPKVSFKVINSAAPLPFKGIINPPVPRP